LLLWKSEGKN